MTVKAAVAIMLVAVLCGGCASLSGTRQGETAGQAAMPLTAANLAQVRAAVTNAKIQAPKPTAKPATKDEYVRFARLVYVDSWAGPWSAAATTETAMAKAKSGDPLARDYLTIMVYDLQLQAAMVGASLAAEDWRDIYVGSGIMTDDVFANYAAMSKCGKVVP